MKPYQWHSPYKSFLLNIIIAALCASSLNTYALNWFIVTSEADSGTGTLREAIETINAGGTDAPNAIAFANNVQTIVLQSNLPIIAPINDALIIDGLAIANLANPQNTIEGDCSLLPSPVDNPQAFSDSIRVTINGSGIPDAVDPDDRWGLNIAMPTTVRGIRIQNITAPGNGSRAVGILFSGGSVNRFIECCEIDHIQNTAYTTNFNKNRAVGIEDESGGGGDAIVSKCYIHNVTGGSIANCNGTIEALESGNAYGILEGENIDTCRIECITSGSINASCEDDIRAIVGRSVGIANAINSPGTPPPWPSSEETNKAGVGSCPTACDQTCSFNTVCIQNSLICDIRGGDIITDQPEVFLSETAGILLGTPSNFIDFLDENALIQNNVIRCIRSGNAITSGDESITIALGSFGIIVYNASEQIDINCNTIDTVQTGSTTLEGKTSGAFPGATYGIWHKINEGNFSSIQCNQISNICGATATVTGTCSIISNSIETVYNIQPATRHTPGGLFCAENSPPIVAGIVAENSSSLTTVNNNVVKNIRGGKRSAQGLQTSVDAIGAAGIYINPSSNSSSISNQNIITSIIGTELIARPGSLGVINRGGTTGLCVISQTITATGNQIKLICEGSILAAQNTLGFNLTAIFFALFKNKQSPVKIQLEEDNASPYAPVITSGIVVSSPNTLFDKTRACTQQDPWCIADNSVDTVIGSSVTGGIQPFGSIAVGIWIQPLPIEALKKQKSFESCVDAHQAGLTSGTAFNNSIHNIIGGTNVPAYGIFLDGSAQFFMPFVPNDERESLFFTVDQNTITTICGSKTLLTFEINLSELTDLCFNIGSTNLEQISFSFLPFEPTSGIYTLFGGCSTLSNNIIKKVKAFNSDARGITTAASSDMLIFGNSCSEIKGYGIFVGGIIATIDVAGELGTDPNDLTLESFASVRNKIHTNSTFDNTNKGIKLGLVDWSNALFGINILKVCPNTVLFSQSRYNTETIPEASVAIFGNHGQPEPCITKVVCNSNGTVTIEIDLKDTHPLTDFVVQFFRNSTNSVPHGEQAISTFDDTAFIFTTGFNGRAQKRFTFMPLVEIQSSDNITAHVTVNDHGQAAITSTYFCDTSEFGDQASGVTCNPRILTHRPNNKPSTASGFAALLNR